MVVIVIVSQLGGKEVSSKVETVDVWDTMQDLRPSSSDNSLRRAMKCMAAQGCEDIPNVQDLLAQIDPDYPDWILAFI